MNQTPHDTVKQLFNSQENKSGFMNLTNLDPSKNVAEYLAYINCISLEQTNRNIQEQIIKLNNTIQRASFKG
jgi:hypothetical protein